MIYHVQRLIDRLWAWWHKAPPLCPACKEPYEPTGYGLCEKCLKEIDRKWG